MEYQEIEFNIGSSIEDAFNKLQDYSFRNKTKACGKFNNVMLDRGAVMITEYCKSCIKMPSYYLTEENHDYWINFIERIKPYIYRDFKQTLRGKRSIPTDKENLTITFKTWNKYNVKKIIVKNNKIKVEEYKKRNETNFQYIKRRIRYAIFS